MSPDSFTSYGVTFEREYGSTPTDDRPTTVPKEPKTSTNLPSPDKPTNDRPTTVPTTKPTSPPSPDGLTYFKADPAMNCSDNTIILTQETCQAAGDAFDLPFLKVVTATDRPTGCFWDQNGHSYLNDNLGATANWGGVGGLCNSPTNPGIRPDPGLQAEPTFPKMPEPILLDEPEPIDGLYTVTIGHSGKCLDVEGNSTANGGKIIQWECHGGNNQKWQIENIGNGVYKIISLSSGKSLDVPSSSKIIQWDYHGGKHQRFRLQPVSGGYQLVSVSDDKCLDVPASSQKNGVNIIQWPCTGNANQLFTLVSVKSQESSSLVTNGLYTVTIGHSGKCLDVEGNSKANGGKIIQWECHGGNNQKWQIENIGNGIYKIISLSSGKSLDVPSSSKIIQWDYHGGKHQRFRLQPVSGGYQLVSVLNNKCLDVFNGSKSNGVDIIQWPCHGGNNQLFTLVLVR